MAPIRIIHLAKELKVKPADIIAVVSSLGVRDAAPTSVLESDTATLVRRHFGADTKALTAEEVAAQARAVEAQKQALQAKEAELVQRETENQNRLREYQDREAQLQQREGEAAAHLKQIALEWPAEAMAQRTIELLNERNLNEASKALQESLDHLAAGNYKSCITEAVISLEFVLKKIAQPYISQIEEQRTNKGWKPTLRGAGDYVIGLSDLNIVPYSFSMTTQHGILSYRNKSVHAVSGKVSGQALTKKIVALTCDALEFLCGVLDSPPKLVQAEQDANNE